MSGETQSGLKKREKKDGAVHGDLVPFKKK